MKETRSLKLNNDFRRVYKSMSNVGKYVVIYAKKNRFPFNRLGLTVSKSTGKAVVRNRLKRLMREGYRLDEANTAKGYDIIIVARRRAVGKTMLQIKKDIDYSMKKLGLKRENDHEKDFN